MKEKDKLDIHYSEPIEKTLKKIEEYFSKEENRKDFLKYCEEESKKDVWTHLHCLEFYCPHNQPKDPDMGTITWCDKYLCEQKEQCEKECGKRTCYYDINTGEEL